MNALRNKLLHRKLIFSFPLSIPILDASSQQFGNVIGTDKKGIITNMICLIVQVYVKVNFHYLLPLEKEHELNLDGGATHFIMNDDTDYALNLIFTRPEVSFSSMSSINLPPYDASHLSAENIIKF